MKKLYKSERNKMISGVCGGIADYFGVDPSLIRVGAVIAGFLSAGTAVIAYIVCACILPTESQIK